ncbi:MAG TPA: hypothetical protein VMX13_06845 [Sedimentisphaerales bacterium]|nr:hypothetical protein [Sedimentisphaerales bacterium]
MNTKNAIVLALAIVWLFGLRDVYAENIDPCDDDSQYAWAENVGWVNFEPNRPEPNVGATVADHNVSGFVWSENIGWINLWPKFGGVANDANGRLSGYAWGENVGWINFRPAVPSDVNCYGVTINSEGNFDGWAWGENIGWIHLKSSAPVAYKVQTSWRGSEILGTCWDPCKCAGQPFGDATCDGDIGMINFLDLGQLKVAFFSCKGDPNYNCCGDFNHDLCINFLDLGILKVNFFTTGYQPSTGNQTCPP